MSDAVLNPGRAPYYLYFGFVLGLLMAVQNIYTVLNKRKKTEGRYWFTRKEYVLEEDSFYNKYIPLILSAVLVIYFIILALQRQNLVFWILAGLLILLDVVHIFAMEEKTDEPYYSKRLHNLKR